MNAESPPEKDPNIDEVRDRAADIEDKLPRLRQLMEQGKVMLDMVRDYATGAYREVPYWAISAISIALLYVLNPVDVILDVIPGIGFLDDAAVVAFCLKLIEREVTKYKDWKRGASGGAPSGDAKVIDVDPGA
jgi:uncharacterized membrane protein YkvA (DUF1232 family)